MDTLTSEALRKFPQMTLPGIDNAISSQGSVAGRLPCVLRDGLTTDLFGPAHVPASRSVPPASSEAQTTNATCGRSSAASSRSAALQAFLANRLRARLEGIGSPLYALTWKNWLMESGPPICALRGSARRTSDSACGSSGWPTPTTRDWKDGANCPNVPTNALLGRTAWLAGWPTPTSKEAAGGEYRNPDKAMARALGPHANDLRDFAQMAGWPTPSANEFGHVDLEALEARRARCKESTGNGNGFGLTLAQAMTVYQPGPMRITADGMLLTGSTAGMESGGRLNPAHSRWLMGYPVAWGNCAATETPSSRKLPPNSSAR